MVKTYQRQLGEREQISLNATFVHLQILTRFKRRLWLRYYNISIIIVIIAASVVATSVAAASAD